MDGINRRFFTVGYALVNIGHVNLLEALCKGFDLQSNEILKITEDEFFLYFQVARPRIELGTS